MVNRVEKNQPEFETCLMWKRDKQCFAFVRLYKHVIRLFPTTDSGGKSDQLFRRWRSGKFAVLERNFWRKIEFMTVIKCKVREMLDPLKFELIQNENQYTVVSNLKE